MSNFFQIVNLLSNDAKCFIDSLGGINYLWISPIQCLLIAYLIYQNVSLAATSGIVIFFITIPLLGSFSKLQFSMLILSNLLKN